MFNELMNAANGIVTGVTTRTSADKHTNTIHMINLIARVYAHTAKLFSDVKSYEEINDKVYELIQDEKVLALVAKRNKIADCDAVSLIEALKWTGRVMVTGNKPKFCLALIEPSEVADSSPELATTQPAVWNALVLEDFHGTDYIEFGNLPNAPVKSVNVLAKSLDMFEVIVER